MKTTKKVGIRDAKAKLSELLREVRGGRIVEISDRGKPVARLVPIDAEAEDERIRQLIRQKKIKPPPGFGPIKLPPPIKLKRPVDLTKWIREDRDSRP